MRVDQFDYQLPPELIAQTPLPRGESRLMVLHREDGRVELRQFRDILEYLRPGDTLVVNDSRVTARRHTAWRESGEPGEALLLRPVGERAWHALVRPGKRLKPGARLIFRPASGEEVSALITGTTPDGGRILEFADAEARDRLAFSGEIPLPPYITESLADEARYQTVYAGPGGSAAAPTAGLHFTEELLAEAAALGVGLARVTLHVGVDTFRPVRTEDIADHVMHGEWYALGPEAAETINATTGRVIAVGTTAVRVLESAADDAGRLTAGTGETRLFITPGYCFKRVDGLLTNFHLPQSTLLMLVSALAGRDHVMRAYETAVRERFRFFSFGDAMLIV
jgi:S-adenosylmethionine:tRNA ribosyltransferase-isomerase